MKKIALREKEITLRTQCHGHGGRRGSGPRGVLYDQTIGRPRFSAHDGQRRRRLQFTAPLARTRISASR